MKVARSCPSLSAGALLGSQTPGVTCETYDRFGNSNNLIVESLRRAELSAPTVEDLQIRQGHWAFVDLVGKDGHIRTVRML